jgi:cysteinyl-tRNA synthetase
MLLKMAVFMVLTWVMFDLINDLIKEERGKKMERYTLYNKNYKQETSFTYVQLHDVREHLEDLYLIAFTLVPNDDERLENKFRYRSKREFDSIKRMNFEELREVFQKEFDWTLEKGEEQ